MLAPKTAHERDRGLAIGPRPAPRKKQRHREMQRGGQGGGRKPEHAGLLQAQPAPIQQFRLSTGSVHGAYQRQCLRVRTQQDVLPVVNGNPVGFDATRAATEGARGFEYSDGAPRRGERHRSGEASVAAADDGDPVGDHVGPDSNNSTTSSMRARLYAT